MVNFKGHPQTEETRKKISNYRTGKKWPEEVKKKITEGLKAFYEKHPNLKRGPRPKHEFGTPDWFSNSVRFSLFRRRENWGFLKKFIAEKLEQGLSRNEIYELLLDELVKNPSLLKVKDLRLNFTVAWHKVNKVKKVSNGKYYSWRDWLLSKKKKGLSIDEIYTEMQKLIEAKVLFFPKHFRENGEVKVKGLIRQELDRIEDYVKKMQRM